MVGHHEFTIKGDLVVCVDEGHENTIIYKVLMALVRKGKVKYSFHYRSYPH
jgi:hypothetical protein